MKKMNFWGFILACLMCVGLTACGGDDGDGGGTPSLDKTSLTLYVGESSILKYSGGNCSWASDNSLIASVVDGVVTANHIGTTTIHANNSTCSVTVKPKYTSYTEPYMGWGSTKSVVKSQMSNYVLKKEDATGLAYYGKGKVTGYVYLFESGTLTSCAMYVSLSYLYDITDFLLERYVVISTEKKSDTEYNIYMGSVDAKMYILLNASTSGCIILYSPVNASKAPKKEDMKIMIRKMISKN